LLYSLILRYLLFILSLLGAIQGYSQCNAGDILTPITVDSISVLPNGDVTICWQASPDPDIAWYYIIGINSLTGANVKLDSVAGGTLCYTILAANNNSSTTPEEYAIGVRDLCNNEMVTVLDFHNTMFLSSAPNVCAATIQFNWNTYDDFTSGTNVLYNIFASENGAPYVWIGNSFTNSFNFTTVNEGSSYDFYVSAVENGGVGPFSSSSNVITLNTTAFLKDPKFLYVATATVVDSQTIDVQFYVDTAADIREYIIKRALDLSNVFTTIGSVFSSQGMNPFQLFSDFSVNANATSYYYKIYAVDICGNLKLVSPNYGRTMLLKASSDKLNAENTLTWNVYEDWAGGVMNYDIYRSVGGIWEMFPITTVTPKSDTMTYVDDISTVTRGNGEFCYKITANENNAIRVGGLSEASSSSNETCVTHDPLLYVPNAFDPLSNYTSTFKPVLTFAEPSSYVFIIYNRWGQKVFETGDVFTGWNGQFDNSGAMSEVGVYVYVINFKSAEGEEFKKTGTVTLIR
jgi:CHU_C Type IX secretion signal domain